MAQQSLNIRDLLRNLRSSILITLVEFLATQVRAGQTGKQNSNRVNINIVMFEKVHSHKISQFKIMIIVKANLGFNYICATPLNTLAFNESNGGQLVRIGIFSPQISAIFRFQINEQPNLIYLPISMRKCSSYTLFL